MYGNDEERDSENEEEFEIFSSSFKPSYVIIALDSHPSMFKKNSTGILPFRIGLEACYNIADSLLFSRDSRTWSPFAVVIAGVATPLITFDKNVIESIKLLKAKSKLPDDALIREFQRKGNLDLSSFFLSCKKLFHEVKSVFYKRTLFYISNDDRPINDKNGRFTALNEIKSFAGSQIEFQIIPTISTFNYKLFYNELFSILGGNRREEICQDTEGLTQKLSSVVLVKLNQRRVIFYPFKGDTQRFLKCLRIHIYTSIQLFNTLTTRDGQKVVNSVLPSDTPLYYRIKYVHEDKGDNVTFDLTERNSLCDYSTPKGLMLSYVADRQVDIGHIFTRPTLIKADPKEELPYFNKFWDNCVASNKVLVCISKIRQPDKIRYVELIPVLIDGVQMFLEKRLPFGNEIVPPYRLDYPVEENDEKRKQAVKALVDKLTFDFNIDMLPDIPFQKKKAYVKAKLLDEPLEPVNEVQVDKATLDSVLEEVVTNIKDKFEITVMEKKRKSHWYTSNKLNKGQLYFQVNIWSFCNVCQLLLKKNSLNLSYIHNRLVMGTQVSSYDFRNYTYSRHQKKL